MGSSIGMNCNYTTHPSGYLKTMSLSRPCPYSCDESATYLFRIPIKNRGDNYYCGGEFQVIGRYAEIDVSEGSILNTIEFVPGTITQYATWNDGRDTIEQDSKMFISFKPQTFMPGIASKGRIRLELPP